MCIFIGHIGSLNFYLGRCEVQIRDQRLRKLPSTEFHPNQITSGILIRHIRSGGPSCPKGPSCSINPYYTQNLQ